MAPQHRFGLAGCRELLECECTRGLEQAIARLGLAVRDHQRFVDQMPQQIEHEPLIDVFIADDLLRQFQSEAAGEHAEAAEHGLLVGGQQAVAPVECGAQRLVTPQLHARAAAQHVEHLVEPCVQAMHAEQRHARRGQFDGERNAVQSPADVDDDGDVVARPAESASRPHGRARRTAPRRRTGRRPRAARSPAPPALRADRPARRDISATPARSRAAVRSVRARATARPTQRCHPQGARSCRERAAGSDSRARWQALPAAADRQEAASRALRRCCSGPACPR